MLLELENAITQRIHEKVGQSAVVMRLVEDLENSGRTNEQAMIIVAYKNSSTRNPNEGAYIPTVRNRDVSFSITLVIKQTQRYGHSFALPLIDLIYDCIQGWIPEIEGLTFQTGFECSTDRFVQATDASQFIYEMDCGIQVLIQDGRFSASPCFYPKEIPLEKLFPKRRCILTRDGRNIGWAQWEKTNADGTKEYALVEDCTKCEINLGDRFDIVCNEDGTANYTFIPRSAISVDSSGNEVINQNLVQTGIMENVWKCSNKSKYPDWCKLKIESALWKNESYNIPTQVPAIRKVSDLIIQV